MVKCIKIIALMALILCIVTPAVSAINVSFADPDATTHKDIYIYNSAGALQGVYNTTSSGITVSGDALVVFKPQYSNPLDDPGTFLSNAIGFLQTNALSLVIIAMLGSLLFKRF